MVPPSPPPPDTTEKPPTEAPKETPPPTGDTSLQVSTEGREPFFVWLGHNGVGIAGLAATVIGAGVGTGFLLAANKANDNSDSVASQIQQHSMDIHIDSRGVCVDPAGKVAGSSVAPENRAAEVQHFQQACALLTDNLDKRKQDRTFATVGFVFAGVGLTATIAAYFLTSGKSSSPAQARVLPVVGPGQAGLTVIGSF